MRHKSVIWIFLLLVFGVPFSLYAVYLFSEKQFGKLPVLSSQVIPAFEFTDQDGMASNHYQWSGKIAVVDFFFTHCPAICPKMTNNLKRVQEAFTEEEIAISS